MSFETIKVINIRDSLPSGVDNNIGVYSDHYGLRNL